jgi:hypothetical protein
LSPSEQAADLLFFESGYLLERPPDRQGPEQMRYSQRVINQLERTKLNKHHGQTKPQLLV